MTKKALLLAFALGLLVPGCITHREGPYAAAEKDPYPKIAEQDSSYTRTEAVYLDKKKVGYLQTFLEVPVGSPEPQMIEPGFHYIKGLDFKNLGFIEPWGTTYRFSEGDRSSEVCRFTLQRNLATFFGKPFGTVELKGIGEE